MATVRRPIPVALHNIAMGKRGPPVTFEQPPKLQVRPTKKSQALAKRVAAVARLNEDTLARLKAASDSLAPVLATKVDVTMPFPRVSSPVLETNSPKAVRPRKEQSPALTKTPTQSSKTSKTSPRTPTYSSTAELEERIISAARKSVQASMRIQEGGKKSPLGPSLDLEERILAAVKSEVQSQPTSARRPATAGPNSAQKPKSPASPPSADRKRAARTPTNSSTEGLEDRIIMAARDSARKSLQKGRWRKVDGEDVWVRDEPDTSGLEERILFAARESLENARSAGKLPPASRGSPVPEDDDMELEKRILAAARDAVYSEIVNSETEEKAGRRRWKRVDGDGNVWIREGQRDDGGSGGGGRGGGGKPGGGKPQPPAKQSSKRSPNSTKKWKRVDGDGNVWIREGQRDDGLEERILAAARDALYDEMMGPAPEDDVLEQRILAAARKSARAEVQAARFESLRLKALAAESRDTKHGKKGRWKKVDSKGNVWTRVDAPVEEDFELEERILAAARAQLLSKEPEAPIEEEEEDENLEERILLAARKSLRAEMQAARFSSLREQRLKALADAPGASNERRQKRWKKVDRNGNVWVRQGANEPIEEEDEEGEEEESLEERIILAARKSARAEMQAARFESLRAEQYKAIASESSAWSSASEQGDRPRWVKQDGEGNVWIRDDLPEDMELEQRILAAAREAVFEDDASSVASSAPRKWRKVDGESNTWVRDDDDDTVSQSDIVSEIDLEEHIIAAARKTAQATMQFARFAALRDEHYEALKSDAKPVSRQANSRWRKIDSDGHVWVRDDAPVADAQEPAGEEEDLESRILAAARKSVRAEMQAKRFADLRDERLRMASKQTEAIETAEKGRWKRVGGGNVWVRDTATSSRARASGSQKPWRRVDGEGNVWTRDEPSSDDLEERIISAALQAAKGQWKKVDGDGNVWERRPARGMGSAEDVEEKILAKLRKELSNVSASPLKAPTTEDMELEERIIASARESLGAAASSEEEERILSNARVSVQVEIENAELEERIIAAARLAVVESLETKSSVNDPLQSGIA